MGATTDKTGIDNTHTIIKVNRLLQGKSQREISQDICPAAELNSFEAGETVLSAEIISALLKRLNIKSQLTDQILQEGYRNIARFNKEFMFNEFDVTNKHFINLEYNEKMFMTSPYILDYLIAKLSFSSVQNRKEYTDIKSLLSIITDHMSDDQKYHYYLCLGIDMLKVDKDLARAKRYFDLANAYANTGQLNYWYAYMYLSERKPIEAYMHTREALKDYFEGTNIVGIISTFELMGLIYYSVSEYDSGIEQYQKALAYTDLAVSSPYQANIKNQIAWGHMRLGDYETAQQYIETDRYNSDITVNASVTKFLIAYHLKSSVLLDALKDEFSFRNRSLHRMIYAVLQKDAYFDEDGHWQIEDDELDALFEFAQFTHFELEKAFTEIAVTHYLSKENYQCAFHYLKGISSRVCKNDNCLLI